MRVASDTSSWSHRQYVTICTWLFPVLVRLTLVIAEHHVPTSGGTSPGSCCDCDSHDIELGYWQKKCAQAQKYLPVTTNFVANT